MPLLCWFLFFLTLEGRIALSRKKNDWFWFIGLQWVSEEWCSAWVNIECFVVIICSPSPLQLLCGMEPKPCFQCSQLSWCHFLLLQLVKLQRHNSYSEWIFGAVRYTHMTQYKYSKVQAQSQSPGVNITNLLVNVNKCINSATALLVCLCNFGYADLKVCSARHTLSPKPGLSSLN